MPMKENVFLKMCYKAFRVIGCSEFGGNIVPFVLSGPRNDETKKLSVTNIIMRVAPSR